MSELRVGIVGCGKIARVAHVPGFKGVPDVAIAALVDANAACAEQLRDDAAPAARVFTDYDAFLGSGLHAVSICTPNHLHASMAIKALQRGLHVLCEKPIAGTLADADAMIAAAGKAGRVLQINQTLRYLPLYATMAKLVREGAIGAPQHVRCIRAAAAPPNVGWSPGADWFVSRNAQGGLLLDIGIHMVDAIRWVAGDVITAFGDLQTRTPGIDVPDNVRALMRHAGGCTSSLEMSWTFPGGVSAFEVYGTTGKLTTAPGRQDLELTTYDNGKPVVSAPPILSSVPDSYACFARAIRGEAPSPTPGELGRDALAICLAIAESSETGRASILPTPAFAQDPVTP